jgi:chromosome segregation ATPase
MKQQLEDRLIELRSEFESGQKALAELENRQAEIENKKATLRNTMLRISGAMQVLQEELEKESKSNETGQLNEPIGGINKQGEGIETG